MHESLIAALPSTGRATVFYVSESMAMSCRHEVKVLDAAAQSRSDVLVMVERGKRKPLASELHRLLVLPGWDHPLTVDAALMGRRVIHTVSMNACLNLMLDPYHPEVGGQTWTADQVRELVARNVNPAWSERGHAVFWPNEAAIQADEPVVLYPPPVKEGRGRAYSPHAVIDRFLEREYERSGGPSIAPTATLTA